MAESNLSKRQTEILGFIAGYIKDHGYPPSVRDIGLALGLSSSSTVHAHLARLERAGALRRDPSRPRAIELHKAQAQSSVASARKLPLVGRIAAGRPLLAEENIEEHVGVPELAGGERGEYVLRVTGDSMRGAGILGGDYVVVRGQSTATDGEIVVALMDGEATVKRFFKEPDCVRLQPENPDFEPIRSRDVEVIGTVVGVFRRIG